MGFPDSIMAADLAEVWGVTAERVRQLAVSGTIPAGQRGKYPCKATLLAFTQYQRETAKRPQNNTGSANRVKDARAREIELRIAQREGELIDLDDAMVVIDVIAGTVRRLLDGLPAQVTRDRAERERLQKATDAILTQLADTIGAQGEALGPGGTAVEAIAEDTARRMGAGKPKLPAKRGRAGAKRAKPDAVHGGGRKGGGKRAV